MYRWDPFAEIASMRDAMDRLMRESFAPGRAGASAPPLEVAEDGDAYQIRLALPGVKPEDVNIQVQQNVLTVSGEFRREEAPQNRRYLHQEHSYGSFSRSISLPGMVDTEKASAKFEHGMLTISLPKREEARPRRIAINSAGSLPNTIEGQNKGGQMSQQQQTDEQRRRNQSPEERSKVEQASGFQGDKQTIPVQGEAAQQQGGTSAATPPASVAAVHPSDKPGETEAEKH